MLAGDLFDRPARRGPGLEVDQPEPDVVGERAGHAAAQVDDLWFLLHLLFERMREYRFFYRDLDEITSRNRKLAGALAGITAAVVGVIGYITVWFGLHVLIPNSQPVNWFGVAVCVTAFIGMTKWKWGIIPVVLGAGALGAIASARRPTHPYCSPLLGAAVCQ